MSVLDFVKIQELLDKTKKLFNTSNIVGTSQTVRELGLNNLSDSELQEYVKNLNVRDQLMIDDPNAADQARSYGKMILGVQSEIDNRNLPIDLTKELDYVIPYFEDLPEGTEYNLEDYNNISRQLNAMGSRRQYLPEIDNIVGSPEEIAQTMFNANDVTVKNWEDQLDKATEYKMNSAGVRDGFIPSERPDLAEFRDDIGREMFDLFGGPQTGGSTNLKDKVSNVDINKTLAELSDIYDPDAQTFTLNADNAKGSLERIIRGLKNLDDLNFEGNLKYADRDYNFRFDGDYSDRVAIANDDVHIDFIMDDYKGDGRKLGEFIKNIPEDAANQPVNYVQNNVSLFPNKNVKPDNNKFRFSSGRLLKMLEEILPEKTFVNETSMSKYSSALAMNNINKKKFDPDVPLENQRYQGFFQPDINANVTRGMFNLHKKDAAPPIESQIKTAKAINQYLPEDIQFPVDNERLFKKTVAKVKSKDKIPEYLKKALSDGRGLSSYLYKSAPAWLIAALAGAGLGAAGEDEAGMASMAGAVGATEFGAEAGLNKLFSQVFTPRNAARAAGGVVGGAGLVLSTPTDAGGGTAEFYARNAQIADDATPAERLDAAYSYQPQTIGDIGKQEQMLAMQQFDVLDLLDTIKNVPQPIRRKGVDATYTAIPEIKMPWER